MDLRQCDRSAFFSLHFSSEQFQGPVRGSEISKAEGKSRKREPPALGYGLQDFHPHLLSSQSHATRGIQAGNPFIGK